VHDLRGGPSNEFVHMDNSKSTLAINYYFDSDELNNRIFAAASTSEKAGYMKAFRNFMLRRGANVVTLDTVDFQDPSVRHVLYFEYNWRYVRSDPYLRRIPRPKRALVLLEPANINPSLYYISWLRDQFHTVFTWDLNLLRMNPGYVRINVPVGAEPRLYRDNRFQGFAFADKRFLVAVSRNRWSYMPQSTYPLRKRAYRYFEHALPGQFDLYGTGWNEPCIFYERWLGHPRFSSWRGTIENTWDAKVQKMAEYKFALCFENNASEPGYISEKMLDCFCARCVPIYYGSAGTDALIPRDAWIDMRNFRGFSELKAYLCGVDESRYNRYLAAIDQFMHSDQLNFFSMDHFYGVLADRLGYANA
jgi:hypothetical protein